MSKHDAALIQAQQDLDTAKQYTGQLQRELETHQASLESHRNGADQATAIDVDATTTRIAEIETELEEHRQKILPTLKSAVATSQAQQLVDQVLSDDSPLLSDHDARALAAQQAGAFRRELQDAKQRLEDNARQVTQLIDALHAAPEIQDSDAVSFPGPNQVTIHGITYSTTGPDDLHFLMQRALKQAWPN